MSERTTGTRLGGRTRLGGVDALRGLAVVGMVVFHTAWDLSYFDMIALDPSRSTAWQAFGHGVAATFLALSGLGLVLAQARGAGWRRELRRIGVIALAASAVTVATRIAMPDQVILFGILHCIALGNLLALPMLRAPLPVVVGLGAIAALAPSLAPAGLPSGLWWLGLSAVTPDTLDYRPLLPWVSPILFGVAFGRLGGVAAFSRTSLTGRGASMIRAAGRHSLAIYLIHQPVIFCTLWAAHALLPPTLAPSAAPGRQVAGFLRQCRADCVAKGADADLCTATCHCVIAALAHRSAGAGELERKLRGSEADIRSVASPCFDPLTSPSP